MYLIWIILFFPCEIDMPFCACSGGKDSCFNMMQCVAEGHQIVALANLRPSDQGFVYIYVVLFVFVFMFFIFKVRSDKRLKKL